MAYRLVEVDFDLSAPGFGRERTIFSFGHQTPPIFSNFAGKTVTRLGLARPGALLRGFVSLTSLIFGGKIAYH